MLFGKQIGLLSHLSNDVVEELLGSLPYKTLNSESILYFQEDFGSSLYILLRGNVSLYQHTHDFRKAIFEVLGAGDCFGESALFKKPHQEFAQIVKGSAKIAICSRSAWQSWISEFPIIQNNLSEILSQRVFFLQKKLSSGTKLSDARLLEYIAYSIQKRGIQKGVEVWVPRILSHDDIACFINSTRQTVSTILAEWKKQQKLDYNRQFFIIKKAMLGEIAALRYEF